MALPTDNITTILAKNAIGESTNAVGALRASTNNNYWGFKVPYIASPEWGVPATGSFGYQLGDYRGYDHTWVAYMFTHALDTTPAEDYYEDGMQIRIDTDEMRGYMVNAGVSLPYVVEAAITNTPQTVWTFRGFASSINGISVYEDIAMGGIPGVAPNSPIYFRVTMSITVPAYRFDTNQSNWNGDEEFVISTTTRTTVPPIQIIITEISAISFKHAFESHPRVRVTCRATRFGGRDDGNSYSWSFSGDIKDINGNGTTGIASGTGTVTGKEVESAQLGAETIVNDPNLTVGTTAYIRVKLPIGVNYSQTYETTSVVISNQPPPQ